MLEKIASNVDRLIDLFTSGFGKKFITDYINVETVNDKYTLVSQDGSLITILNIRGNLKLYNVYEYYENMRTLESKLNSLMSKKDHKLQLFFEYDHDNTRKRLRDKMHEARETIKRIELNVDDVLDEREENLLKYVCDENFYIALWTTTASLSKEQVKNQKAKKAEMNQRQNFPIVVLGQDPLRGNTEIIEKHASFVSNFISSLADVSISSYQVDVRTALREMRKCFDKKFTEETWSPFIPGDTVLPSVRRSSPSIDTYDIMYPKISHQICPSEAKIITSDVVEMGDRIYSSCFFELFPQTIESFQDFFQNAANQNLPWRYSLLIEGGGLSNLQMKGMISHLLAFTNSGNKLIKNDIDNVKEYNGAIVEVRATFTTWASRDNIKLLNTRYENLKNALGSWGNPEVSKTTGDPVAALACTSLAATQGNIGTKSAAPLGQVLFMSPFSRPCSVWENGSVILRTPDGKIIPYEPFSSKQTTWVELIAAKMGSGKSVLMNVLHLALCFNPGITELPRIGIIDIGPSSAGLISLIREALPEHKRHLVMGHKLKNIREQSINPFDTCIGSREPTALEKIFLNNFIGLLATDPVCESVPEGMSGLIGKVIEEVYFMRSDKGSSPNQYNLEINKKVDIALFKLKKEGIMIPKMKIAEENGTIEKILWWEVVDFLFVNGYELEAKLAQRYAVPKVIDMLEAVNTDKIKSEYSQEEIKSFIRNIKDSIMFYPVLSDVTKFDVDLARIVSIDLDDVAKDGGAVAERMSAIMYMLSRYLIAKDYYVDGDVAQEVPVAVATRIELPKSVPVEKYKEYHYKRGVNIKKEQKRLAYDEFHRLSKNQAAIHQVIGDIRVGRKYQVDIMLASQSLEDFDKTILGFSTAVFVMDGKSQQVIDNVKNLLGMKGETVEYILKNQIKGPGRGGGVFLAKFDTKDGDFSLLASATLGSIELWAFNTSGSDVYVRNGLYDVMNSADARRLLAKYYPGGSIKDEVEKMLELKQREKSSDQMMISEKEEHDIYDQILQKLKSYAVKEGYEMKDRVKF